MTDRPIIFSAPMVRALLDGRKTQTRRLLKPQPVHGSTFQGIERDGQALFAKGPFYGKQRMRYAPGDRLYVREHWRTAPAYDDLSPSEMGGEEPVKYEADGDEQMWGWPERFIPGRFRQGMHMPRWASRLTLTVTDVRVQRLQDISEADAKAEGAPAIGADLCPPECEDIRSYCWGFQNLWNSLHGVDAWDANPWVVALTFTVQRGNIDRVVK